MKKSRKSVLALVLILSVCLSLFSGCKKTETVETTQTTEDVATTTTDAAVDSKPEAKSTDPLEMISDGRYVYSFFAEGNGDFTSYFHFYDQVPELGAVFYAGFMNNGMNFTGTYTVEKKDFDYALYTTRDEIVAKGDMTKGTAPYTITFYDWDGNVIDSCGFDGEILYNDMDVIAGMGSGPVTYAHDIDMENSKYKETFADEAGVSYLDFVSPTDETATLSLFHNIMFRDMINVLVEGAWAVEPQADGSKKYTLTPTDSANKTAVLVVSADQAKATYSVEGAADVELVNVKSLAAKVTNIFTGKQNVAQYKTDADLTLSLYDDGTCILEANIFKNVSVIDKGTYKMATDGYTFEFTLDTAGDIKSVLNGETRQISLPYKATTKDLGDFDTTLMLQQEGVSQETTGTTTAVKEEAKTSTQSTSSTTTKVTEPSKTTSESKPVTAQSTKPTTSTPSTTSTTKPATTTSQTTPSATTTSQTSTTAVETKPVADTKPASSTAAVLFSFKGTYTTFDCLADNTYVFKYESYKVEEKGTWNYDPKTYTFSITQENGNVIKASIGGAAHDMTFEYAAVVSNQLKDNFTCAGEVWQAALYK